MNWLQALGEAAFGGAILLWLPVMGVTALVVILILAELLWPLHRDQRDASRIPGNFAIFLLNLGVTALLPLTGVAAAEWARDAGFGVLHWVAAPIFIVVAITVIVRSLLVYWLHRLAHRVPLLWRMHRVHHCDTEVDLSTGLRHHPLEVVYVATITAAAAALIGLSPVALAVYELVAIAFALWTHANTSLPEAADRHASLLLMTPTVHHVHHSAHQEQTDSNYGDVFTLWDRLLGTFQAPPRDTVRALRLGLGDEHDARAKNILFQLGAPFRP